MKPSYRSILWTPVWNPLRQGVGLEHLVLRADSADSVIVAFDEDGRPFRLTYELAWDDSWRLQRACVVVVTEQQTRTLTLTTDGRGHWRDGGGSDLSRLDGCIDIDIWPTPFTNTFPLRRQPLAVGEHRDFVMAWISAPELTLDPVPQRYTRVAERRYLYENRDGSGFRAELDVDEDCVVLDYEGSFQRVESARQSS